MSAPIRNKHIRHPDTPFSEQSETWNLPGTATAASTNQ